MGMREFVVNYTPKAVAGVAGVAVSTRDIQKSPLFTHAQNSDALHIKTVTSVTPVTEHSLHGGG